MKTFQNKHIIVTGGAEGIGKSLVLFLMQAGANVVVYDLKTPDYVNFPNPDEDNRLTFYKGDVTKKDEVEKFSEFVARKFGHLDMLINNAGVSIARKKAAETPDQLSEFIFNVNYWGAVYFTKSFVPLMRTFGVSKIVNVCSIYSLFSVRDRAAYCASKSALMSYSNALRLELKSKKIGVICVFPGRVNTQITQNSMGWMNESEKLHAIKAQNNNSALSPESAAMQIIRGIMKNKSHIYVGFDAKIAWLLLRLFPVKGEMFINKLIKRSELKSKKKEPSSIFLNRPVRRYFLRFHFLK